MQLGFDELGDHVLPTPTARLHTHAVSWLGLEDVPDVEADIGPSGVNSTDVSRMT